MAYTPFNQNIGNKADPKGGRPLTHKGLVVLKAPDQDFISAAKSAYMQMTTSPLFQSRRVAPTLGTESLRRKAISKGHLNNGKSPA